MVGDLEGLYKTVTLAMYGGVIALSVLFQGGNALYYFTRRRHVEDFIAETPAMGSRRPRRLDPGVTVYSARLRESELRTSRGARWQSHYSHKCNRPSSISGSAFATSAFTVFE